MNDIYLSLKPIYEHFEVCGKSPNNYINKFLKRCNGCYCFHVDKIVINTKQIIKYNTDINIVINHEVIHHILNKNISENANHQWDNISAKIEKYLWQDK